MSRRAGSRRRLRTVVARAASRAASGFDRAALRLMEHLFLSGEAVEADADVRGDLNRWEDLYVIPAQDAPAHYSPTRPIGEVDVVSERRFRAGSRRRIQFDSPYETVDPGLRSKYLAYEPNHRCDVVVWRRDESNCPTVICLHAWCMGIPWFDERVFAARALFERGFHVVLVTMPFHGSRTPSEARFGGQMFPSPQLDRTNEAFRQAVIEVRSVREWLSDHGHDGPFGLMGISLGGYVSSLMASLWDDWEFVVPIISPASFADVLWWHGEDRPMREVALRSGVDLQSLRDVWAAHCPLRYDLKLERDRALIVAATGDEIVRPAQSRALWSHWGEPELRWVVGSHLAQLRWVAGSLVTRRGKVDFMAEVLPFIEKFGR